MPYPIVSLNAASPVWSVSCMAVFITGMQSKSPHRSLIYSISLSVRQLFIICLVSFRCDCFWDVWCHCLVLNPCHGNNVVWLCTLHDAARQNVTTIIQYFCFDLSRLAFTGNIQYFCFDLSRSAFTDNMTSCNSCYK